MPARRRRVPSESSSVPLIIDSSYIPCVEFQSSSNTRKQYESRSGTVTAQQQQEERMPRDRTQEFGSAVRSLQGRQLSRPLRDAKKAHVQSYGEFMMVAKSIGRNIASTYTKLEKLTLLVKRKSLFNDKPTEIQELSYIIKEDLKGINEQLSRLQNISKRQYLTEQKTGHKHLLSHSNSVVMSLQSKLANVSNEFKHVLDTRTQNLKEAKDRRDQFSEIVSPSPSIANAQVKNNSSYWMEENGQTGGSGQEMGDINESDERCSLLQSHQQQSQMMRNYDDTDQYLQSRADTMHDIESTIVELGGIFQQLAYMVKEQDEMVERIDTNIMEAEMNVDAAHNQILKYFQSVTSNRWLMVKIFAVLMFFFTFFAVFLS